MHKLETLRDTLCEELEKVAKKEEITSGDLDIIDKLAHSIKNLDKILDESSYGYSRNSYARRGRDGDNDGRYREGRSRDYDRSYDSYDYNRDRGYSNETHRMTDKLRRMMEDTSNDRERDTIMRCISQLENE